MGALFSCPAVGREAGSFEGNPSVRLGYCPPLPPPFSPHTSRTALHFSSFPGVHHEKSRSSWSGFPSFFCCPVPISMPKPHRHPRPPDSDGDRRHYQNKSFFGDGGVGEGAVFTKKRPFPHNFPKELPPRPALSHAASGRDGPPATCRCFRHQDRAGSPCAARRGDPARAWPRAGPACRHAGAGRTALP